MEVPVQLSEGGNVNNNNIFMQTKAGTKSTFV